MTFPAHTGTPRERLRSTASALPGGTVTFAFTDIESSTSLLHRLGDGYGEVIGEHRRIVRTTFGEAQGIEIDTQGDAFFFVFSRARDAVSAAAEIQRRHAGTRWPESVSVRVRIGLHTGEPALGEEGYLGIDVVRAARICTAARGGQVLLSETTRALVGSKLPGGLGIVPVGERRLKDLDAPECIYELSIDGLDAEERSGASQNAVGEDIELEIEKRFGTVGRAIVHRLGEEVSGSLPLGSPDLERLAARAAASIGDRVRGGMTGVLRVARRLT